MNTSRRGFLRGIAGIGALGIGGCAGFGRNGKVRLACCGVWGKGFSDWMPMLKSGKAELVALCDVDRSVLPMAQEQLTKWEKFDLDLSRIPFYDDSRRLLDDHASTRHGVHRAARGGCVSGRRRDDSGHPPGDLAGA